MPRSPQTPPTSASVGRRRSRGRRAWAALALVTATTGAAALAAGAVDDSARTTVAGIRFSPAKG